MFKLAILAVVVALVAGDAYRPAPYGHSAPYGGYQDKYENIDYNFNYDVKDDYTYNQQSREEYKNGNYVAGSYSLLQPDGRVRVVKYTADDYGFHATVDHSGDYNKGYSAPAYSAPAYKAPAYSAPAYKAPSYSAPAYKAPAYSAPAYKAPAYSAPAYSAPAYKAPAYAPAY